MRNFKKFNASDRPIESTIGIILQHCVEVVKCFDFGCGFCIRQSSTNDGILENFYNTLNQSDITLSSPSCRYSPNYSIITTILGYLQVKCQLYACFQCLALWGTVSARPIYPPQCWGLISNQWPKVSNQAAKYGDMWKKMPATRRFFCRPI